MRERYQTRIYLQRFDDGLLVKLGEYNQWLKPARRLHRWLADTIRSEKCRRSLNLTADADDPPVESQPVTLDVADWTLTDLATACRYCTQASIACQGPLSGKLFDELCLMLCVAMQRRSEVIDKNMSQRIK